MSDNQIKRNLKNQIEEQLSNIQFTRETHLKASHRLERNADALNWIQIVLSAVSTAGIISLFLNDTITGKIIGAACSALLFATSMYVKDKDLLTESKKHRATADKLFGLREEYKLLLATFDSKDVSFLERSVKDFIERTQTIYDSSPNCLNTDYEAAKDSIKKGILLVTPDDKKNTVPKTDGDGDVG